MTLTLIPGPDTQLVEPVSVDDNGASLTVDGPVTDTQLRATAVPVSGTFFQATQPISGTVTANLGTIDGAATETTLGTRLSESDYDTKTGSLTETAPASDTASSGLNGRLQRIAQRITSLMTLLPGSLGQKTMANSLAVVVASDQSAVPVSGTVTAAINGLPTTEFTQVAVTVGQVAVPAANLASRKTLSIKALAANGAAVYIGETGVTTTTGYELSAGESIEIDADATVALFAVSASGTQRVSCAEIA